MKAVQILEYGEDVVEINPNAEMPSLSSGKLLIKVNAAGVNPFDWKVTLGYVSQGKTLSSPMTIGGDFAGTVSDVGEGVDRYRRGDPVYGSGIVLSGGSGAFAEYLITGEHLLSEKPKKANDIEAAALPLVGVSALDVISNKVNLKKGQKILIHGGSGGIGSMAIQIAKYLGAYVATTGRKGKADYLKALGANEIIDYRNEKFEERLSDFDAVFDTVGGDTYERSFQVLKKGGMIVSMLEQPDKELMEKYGVNALGQFTKINSEDLKKLAELYDQGIITINIDRTFPLDKAGDALKYQRESSVTGKVVIEMD